MKKSTKRLEFERECAERLKAYQTALLDNIYFVEAATMICHLFVDCFRFGINPLPSIRKGMPMIHWVSSGREHFSDRIMHCKGSVWIWVMPWDGLHVISHSYEPTDVRRAFTIGDYENDAFDSAFSICNSLEHFSVVAKIPVIFHSDKAFYSQDA